MDSAKSIMFYVNDDPANIPTICSFKVDLQKYIKDESRYIITHEIAQVTNKPHYHVIVEMSTEEYTKYADAILRKKYKLKGTKKEYGKVKQIKDINKSISYILKDLKEKDPAERLLSLESNLEEDKIQEYLEQSYKKEDEKSHIEKCLEQIAPMKLQYEYTDNEIMWYKIRILEYFQEHKLDTGFKKIDRIFEMYMSRQYHLPATTIYEILRQNFKNRI